jgi:hypothetical protein
MWLKPGKTTKRNRQLKQTEMKKNKTCPDSSVGFRDKTTGKQSHIERSRNVFKQSSTTLRLTQPTAKNKKQKTIKQ